MHRLLLLVGLLVAQAAAKPPHFEMTHDYLSAAFRPNERSSTVRPVISETWQSVGPDNTPDFQLDPRDYGRSVESGRVRQILQVGALQS